MFGEFIKEKRLKLDLSLREFCRRIDEDPSNWSKVERKVLPPPQDKSKLKKIAKALDIKTESEDWNNLTDYANVDAGIIPEYIKMNKEVLKSLPAFFRTVSNVKPTKEEILKLIEKLKKDR